MNTATQTPPATELADRFRCESEVPDPPRDAAGRKQYWEDTVAEAVAELRRRLASTRDEKSFQALQMILDLEKTRLRHKAPVAGTEVRGYSSPLPPMEQCVPGGRYDGPKKAEAKTADLTPPAAPATLSVPERVEETVADAPTLPTSPRRGEVGCDVTGRGATSQTDPMPARPQPAGRGQSSSETPPPRPPLRDGGGGGFTT